MSETSSDDPTAEDALRQHSEAPVEGPTEDEEPDDGPDLLREHSETAPEG
jgi:hypothetical protein